MTPVRACGVVVALLLVCVPLHAKVYSSVDDEELFDQFHGSSCDKLGVGDGYQYQVIVTSDVAMAVGNVFANPPQRCSVGFKFNQDACACVYQPILPDVARELPTPTAPECTVLANISYNSASDSYNSTTYVELGRAKMKANLNVLRKDGMAGSTYGSVLELSGVPLVMRSFQSNDLMGPWAARLRILPSEQSSTPMVLLTDDCDDSKKEDRQEKSTELVLSGNTLNVFFRFSNGTQTPSCQVTPDSNGWIEIKVSSKKTEIRVTVNGDECVVMDQGAPLARTDCALYLGASPIEDIDPFIGYLDHFQFYKNPQNCQ